MDSNPTRPSIVLRGYAGWLEFFGFCQLYVGPVFTALAVIVSLFLQQILQQKFGGELIYSIVQLVGLIIFTVCGSLVGEMLRHPNCGGKIRYDANRSRDRFGHSLKSCRGLYLWRSSVFGKSSCWLHRRFQLDYLFSCFKAGQGHIFTQIHFGQGIGYS